VADEPSGLSLSSPPQWTFASHGSSQGFGDWIQSLSSGKTYSNWPN
jgi:hypothetical protein